MKYCEHIAHTMSFNEKDILPCCTPSGYNPPEYYNSRLDSPSVLATLDINKKQQEFFKKINSESITKYSCPNCLFCKEIDEIAEEDNKINSIFLRQWVREKESFSINYNAFDMINKMYAENKIDAENLTVRIQSTDLSEVTDLDKYLDLFSEKGVSVIHLSTDNIIFSEKLALLMKNEKASINICLDAGNEEMYKKIKKSDNFNSIIETLKKYGLHTGDTDVGICIHFVLQKDLNDNKTEIDSFIHLMKELGIKNIGVRINNETLNSYLLKNDENIMEYKNLVTYFYEEANKYGFTLDNDSCIEQNFVLEKKSQKKGFFAGLFK